MTASETSMLKSLQLTYSVGDTRLWRNNVGMAWQGTTQKPSPHTMLIHHPRAVHFGLCEGSSDLIGYKSVIVTQDMVGKRVALFVAIEGKKRLVYRKGQKEFLQLIRDAGGLSGVAIQKDDAYKILGGQNDDNQK